MKLKPLVNQKFLLQKIPGKGGWTYADLPQVTPDSHAPFGWIKVKGTIDGVEIKKYHLMPYGNGKLFLPVNAEIRKKIQKEAGDYVHVILYPDNEPIKVPDEMMDCLKDEPKALKFFNALHDKEKEKILKWIYSVKTVETKVKRMAEAVSDFAKNKLSI